MSLTSGLVELSFDGGPGRIGIMLGGSTFTLADLLPSRRFCEVSSSSPSSSSSAASSAWLLLLILQSAGPLVSLSPTN